MLCPHMRGGAVGLLVAVLLAGCAPDAEPPAAASRCSAAGVDLSPFTDRPDLTGAANATRRRIAAEAVACDLEALAAIAGEEFTYSFGVPGDPAVFWREREEAGDPVLWYLVTLLRLDPGFRETGAYTLYSWPRAHASDAGEARAELEPLFGADTVAGWFAPEGYLGWRVGIRSDGAWMFFVIGD